MNFNFIYKCIENINVEGINKGEEYRCSLDIKNNCYYIAYNINKETETLSLKKISIENIHKSFEQISSTCFTPIF